MEQSLSVPSPCSSWTCHVCTLKNPSRKKRCDACETRRPPKQILRNKANKKECNTENVHAIKDTDKDKGGSVVMSWLSNRRRRKKRKPSPPPPSSPLSSSSRLLPVSNKKGDKKGDHVIEQNKENHTITVRISGKHDYNDNYKDNNDKQPYGQLLTAIWPQQERMCVRSNCYDGKEEGTVAVRVYFHDNNNSNDNNNTDSDNRHSQSQPHSRRQLLTAIWPRTKREHFTPASQSQSTLQLISTTEPRPELQPTKNQPQPQTTTASLIAVQQNDEIISKLSSKQQQEQEQQEQEQQEQQQQQQQQQTSDSTKDSEPARGTGPPPEDRQHDAHQKKGETKEETLKSTTTNGYGSPFHANNNENDSDPSSDVATADKDSILSKSQPTTPGNDHATLLQQQQQQQHQEHETIDTEQESSVANFLASPSGESPPPPPPSSQADIAMLSQQEGIGRSQSSRMDPSPHTFTTSQQEDIGFSQLAMTQQACNFEYTQQSQDNCHSTSPLIAYQVLPSPSLSSTCANKNEENVVSRCLNKWLDPPPLSNDENTAMQTTQELKDQPRAVAISVARTNGIPRPGLFTAPPAVNEQAPKAPPKTADLSSKFTARQYDTAAREGTHEDNGISGLIANQKLTVGKRIQRTQCHDNSELIQRTSISVPADIGTDIRVLKGSVARASELFLGDSVKKLAATNNSAVVNYPTIDDIRTEISSQQGVIPSIAAFQTAGKGTKIKVSEETLARASQLLENSISCNDHPTLAATTNAFITTSEIKRPGPTLCPVAISQKGKRIEVTEDSLDRATLLLHKPSPHPNYDLLRASPTTVFQTAGKGLEIAVSEESIAKATKVLQHVSAPSTRVPKRNTTNANLNIFPAVTPNVMLKATASKESATRAPRVLHQCTGSSVQRQLVNNTSSTVPFTSEPSVWSSEPIFEITSKSKNIELSKKRINKAAAHSMQNKAFAAPLSGTLSTSPYPTFQTAGKGTTIEVSEESMANASHVLHNPNTFKSVNHREKHSINVTEAAAACTKKKGSSFGAPRAMFETAGKRAPIQVSEESIHNAAQILLKKSHREIVLDQSPLSSTPAFSSVPVFRTARKGVTLVVSEESTTKASQLLQDSTVLALNVQKENIAKSATVTSFKGKLSSAEPPIAVFQTAGQKTSIHVSEESLFKAKQLLKNTSTAPSHSLPRRPMAALENARKGTNKFIIADGMAKVSEPDQYYGVRNSSAVRAFGTKELALGHSTAIFHTAGKRKTIEISEESIDKTSQLRMQKAPTVSSLYPSAPSMVAFETAGKGAKICVSEESMTDASELLSRTQENCLTCTTNTDFEIQGSVLNAHTSTSHTAGKRATIHVSEESTEKASQSLLYKPPIGLSPGARHNSPTLTTTTGFETTASTFNITGFATAGKGKKISISEESMTKASELLQTRTQRNGAISEDSTDFKMKPLTIGPPSTAFRTDGKRAPAQIPEESLVKATQCLNKTIMVSHCSLPPSTVTAIETSGKGRHASIPGGTAKALKLLKQPRRRENGTTGAASVSTLGPTTTFQTAGKRISTQISEKSMSSAARLVQDASIGPSPDRSVKHIAAFETAGKKAKISISEESMVKASELLRQSGLLENGSASTTAKDFDRKGSTLSCPTAVKQTTSNGETIQVSDESMNKAAQMLNTPLIGPPRGEIVTPMPVFDSAGKESKISISEESTTKASEILQQSSTHEHGTIGETEKSCELTTPSTYAAVSFYSAGKGVKLHVSDEDAKRASDFLEGHTPNDSLGISNNEGVAPLATFETVGKETKISISEASMAKGVQLRRKEFLLLNSRQLSQVAPEAASIQTARKRKKIQFPEGSMIDSIRLFTESDPPKDDALEEATPIAIRKTFDKENCLLAPKISAGAYAEGRYEAVTPRYYSETKRNVADQRDLETSMSDTHIAIVKSATPKELDNANLKTQTHTLVRQTSIPRVSHHTSSVNSFTPHQTPTSRKAVVTMSTNVKNPYLRKRNNDAMTLSETTNEDDYSPVPFKFHHVEENFRGKEISPNSISRAGSVLSHIATKQPSSGASGTPRILNFSTQNETLFRSRCVPSIPPDGEDSARTALVQILDNKKTSLRVTLSELASYHGGMATNTEDCLQLGVSSVTINVNSVTANALRFDATKGLPVYFIGDKNHSVENSIGSYKDFQKVLVTRGCDANLLTEKWLSNHIRWIVWKLASMERRFPLLLAGHYLTSENLLNQLQRRYKKEIIGGKRSALRKVLNRDVACSTLMILCVSQVCNVKAKPSKISATNVVEENTFRLELTDGWYSVQTCLDSSLTEFARKGTIKIGTKLLICNATMKGAEDGIDPLDTSYSSSAKYCSVLFSLVANSTRLAKWDAKLGFVAPSQYLRSQYGLVAMKSITSIIPGGGNIPLIDLIVCRKYPRLFIEQLGSDNKNDLADIGDGRSSILTEAQEESVSKDFEKRRHRAIEKIQEDISKDCEKDVDDMAPEIWKRIMICDSPVDLYERLQPNEKMSVDRWTEKRAALLHDRVYKEIEAEMECDDSLIRKSSPFVRVFVKSYDPANRENDTNGSKGRSMCAGAILTIWRVSEDQLNILKEGTVIRIRNLPVRSSSFEGLLHLSTGAKTIIEKIPSKPSQLSLMGFQGRSFVSLFRVVLLSKKLLNKTIPLFPAPEVDVAGIVMKVVEEGSGSQARHSIYITDESGLLLRVHRDENQSDNDSLRALSKKARQNVENVVSVAFHDLRVMSFDPIENCAVAVFSQTSSVAQKTGLRRRGKLQHWSVSSAGERLLTRISACVDANVPMMEHLDSKVKVALGYIVGFSISTTSVLNSHDASFAPLQVLVDCGGEELQIWEFPLFLLEEALRLCSRSGEAVAANLDEERIHLTLKHLGRIFRGSGILLHFVLHQNLASSNGYSCEVRQLKAADPPALAQVHASALYKPPKSAKKCSTSK